jgi:hypothetical protein
MLLVWKTALAEVVALAGAGAGTASPSPPSSGTASAAASGTGLVVWVSSSRSEETCPIMPPAWISTDGCAATARNVTDARSSSWEISTPATTEPSASSRCSRMSSGIGGVASTGTINWRAVPTASPAVSSPSTVI